MSVKKYKSAAAIEAEIERLKKEKESLTSAKSEVFMKALITSSIENTFFNAEDAVLREAAKMIQENFANILAQAKDNVAEKRASKNPKDVPTTAETSAAEEASEAAEISEAEEASAEVETSAASPKG